MEEGKGTVGINVSARFPDLLLCREPGLGGPSRGRDASGSPEAGLRGEWTYSVWHREGDGILRYSPKEGETWHPESGVWGKEEPEQRGGVGTSGKSACTLCLV